MNIALFGYGKMGKMIEKIAVRRGHQIVARIDLNSPQPNFSNIEVAIDFSTPHAAFDNIMTCIDHGVPIISGTTGWLHDYDKAVSHCKEQNGAFIYASNFSLGVNIFFELNTILAKMMANLDSYAVRMEETHHNQKLDTPSGTAITLAEDIIANTNFIGWQLNEGSDREIPIVSYREGQVPGTHIVRYISAIDNIEIKHTAHNRQGFALGAVTAAEWLQGKTGVFTMKDVLNLG